MVKNILWRLVKELWFPLLCLWAACKHIFEGTGETADKIEILLVIPVVLTLTFSVIYDEFRKEKKIKKGEEKEAKE